jgi:hypothetical protein
MSENKGENEKHRLRSVRHILENRGFGSVRIFMTDKQAEERARKQAERSKRIQEKKKNNSK